MKFFLLKSIKYYQKFISPMLGPRCRHIPTCSQYTYEAVQVHGFIKGIILGILRILRCNPLFKPRYDPVPQKKPKISLF
ncbi:MAG: membrane protein insertion efficiency factor YidD [Epulopiscium sp. Nele67-Bin004]|nr:MAG: membrane protein insertion efficiency factor YidD [Epulopiscium sp. Nele67-Bin004]